MTRTLAVRLDALGDVLVTGPAIRALATTSTHLTLLAGPRGEGAAKLLPGVDDIVVWTCPWIEPGALPVAESDIQRLVGRLRGRFDRAVIFTSYHQDPLPTALVLRMAGIPWIGAISEEFPGGLLNLRHQVEELVPEPERALSLALASGGRLTPDDDGRLAIAGPLPATPVEGSYVVLHPGTSVEARAWAPERFAELAVLLADCGRTVVVTGGPAEAPLTRVVAGDRAIDLGGRTGLRALAGVLAGADVVVACNTGPAHLAAAVGTPVVSLFAPTVPAEKWAPYGVPRIVLGDQWAPCAGSRATTCPVPGHPCLNDVRVEEVADAVGRLAAEPQSPAARPKELT